MNVTIVKEKELRLFSNYIIDEAKYLTKLIGESITDLIGINVSINERNGIFVCDKKNCRVKRCGVKKFFV